MFPVLVHELEQAKHYIFIEYFIINDGVMWQTILNILENFDMQKYGFGSADAMQIMAEAEKHAYADRSEYLGDPDFVKVPWQALTNKAYAKSIADQIDINKAKPSSEIRPGKLAPYESNQTTHYSVVDKDGNAVAVTYTLNTTFLGSMSTSFSSLGCFL